MCVNSGDTLSSISNPVLKDNLFSETGFFQPGI